MHPHLVTTFTSLTPPPIMPTTHHIGHPQPSQDNWHGNVTSPIEWLATSMWGNNDGNPSCHIAVSGMATKRWTMTRSVPLPLYCLLTPEPGAQWWHNADPAEHDEDGERWQPWQVTMTGNNNNNNGMQWQQHAMTRRWHKWQWGPTTTTTTHQWPITMPHQRRQGPTSTTATNSNDSPLPAPTNGDDGPPPPTTNGNNSPLPHTPNEQQHGPPPAPMNSDDPQWTMNMAHHNPLPTANTAYHDPIPMVNAVHHLPLPMVRMAQHHYPHGTPHPMNGKHRPPLPTIFNDGHLQHPPTATMAQHHTSMATTAHHHPWRMDSPAQCSLC